MSGQGREVPGLQRGQGMGEDTAQLTQYEV